MKTSKIPTPALCDLPLVEAPGSAIEKASSPVSFNAHSDVLSVAPEFTPRLKLRHLACHNAAFEFPFRKL